jgi:predicted nuclease of predicted toxin-antitoxin system
MERFLIDECLSASLVAVAKERGIAADFAPHLGLSGWQDWNIVRYAFENSYIVVTNNRRDFLKEYLKYDVHEGLVVIVPHVDRADQIRLFSGLLDYLATMNELPMNKLIEVLADGTIHLREWTSEDHDVGHIGNPSWP